MPGVITAVIEFAGWLLTAEGTLAAVARFAASLLLSVVASKLFGPKVPKGVGLSGIQLTTRSTTEYRKVVYGQALVSGPVAYNNTSNTNNQDLWFAIAMCQGLSEDLVEVRLDADAIPKADIAWTAGVGAADGAGSGAVSTAKYLGTDSPASSGLFVYYYLGDDAQPAPGILTAEFSDITTAWRMRGVTYVIFRLRFNENTSNVWKEGVPGNLKAVIKGRRIYDPRKDSTNGGAGTHRYTDATTWEWSDNPALCTVDYLVTYMGVDPALSILWTTVAASADDCDVLVAVPPSASPANTEKRFTCNGAVSLGSSHKENLDALLSSMDGRLSYVSGQWQIRASVFEASSRSLTEDDLAGSISVRGSAPRSDRFNTVRGFFVDPTQDYQPSEFPLVSKAAYITRDNGDPLDFELSLPFTNADIMAQRIAFRLLEQGNNQITVQVPLKAVGADIAVGDVIDLTISELSWTSKTFRVIDWSRDSSTLFTIAMREDVSASYDDPLVAEYTVLVKGALVKPADIVPPPSGLTAVAVAFGIKLSWTNPDPALFDLIEVFESDTSAWAAASKIAEVTMNTVMIPYTTAVQKYFWVRAKRVDVVSLRSPNSDVSTIQATPTILGATSAFFNGLEAGDEFSAWEKPGAETGTLIADMTTVFSGAQSGNMDSDLDVAASPAVVLSSGQTGSHRVKIPEDLALIFAGQLVVVSVIARQALSTPSTSFAMAYSTNDNGNSGWQTFVPTPSYVKYSFEYQVPLPVAGGDDWLGIHPDTGGAGLNLLVDHVSVVIKGDAGATGSAGVDAVSGYLTNDSSVIPTDGLGNNGDFSSANGEFKVFDGVVDETANATFSEVSETNVTGTINTAVNTPIAGQPKGYYEITAITSSNGRYKIRAVFGGVTIDKEFALSRSVAPLSASVSGGNISETVANGLVNPVPNSSRTCVASGGTPAYTYSWVRVSGATQIIANSSTAATTNFQSTGTNVQRSAVFRCDVDDAASAGPVQSNTFNINVIHGVLP